MHDDEPCEPPPIIWPMVGPYICPECHRPFWAPGSQCTGIQGEHHEPARVIPHAGYVMG